MSFFEELKRRNVFRVGMAYLISAWVLLQFVDIVLENIQAPVWVMQVFMLALAIGFPIAIFFAWAFEMTPEGIKKEKDVDRSKSITPQTGQKLNGLIIGVLLIALGWFVWDKFGSSTELAAPVENAHTTAAEGRTNAGDEQESTANSIAVLPFVAMSSGPDDEYFADGLTEEILNSLAQLPELLITARTSSFHFKGQDIPIQDIAAKLGVGHIVEGSVRRSGERLRITAQLIRSSDGFHLWSENYDSNSEDTIQVQEDIAEKIAVAMNVIMDEEKREAMRQAGLRDVEAFIDFQKARELLEEAHGETNMIETLRQANLQYEKVMGRVPGFPPAHIDHTDLYVHILLEDANGQAEAGVTEQELSEAPGIIEADLAMAAEHARNASERNSIELDQAYLSGNWWGVQQKLDRFLLDSGCSQPAWVQAFTVMYGESERYTPRARDIRECNPMASSSWGLESQALMWAGDAAEALKVAREGNEVAPSKTMSSALIRALVFNGLYEEADSVITTQVQSKEGVLQAWVYKAAVMGNKEGLASFQQELLKETAQDAFWSPSDYARAGDRENANLRAAELDSQPFGSQTLLMVIVLCACGAPWDIEVTPNFAEKVEEAGMSWPPASPVTFPLKDW